MEEWIARLAVIANYALDVLAALCLEAAINNPLREDWHYLTVSL